MYPLLKVQNLVHEFSNGNLGLNAVNMIIESGEFLVLAGPNGSGKTILMQHLNALMRPTSGEVLLEGISVCNNPALARRRIGLVFQDADTQIVGQTVRRDVAFGPENLKLPRETICKRIDAALKGTGLIGFDQRLPHTLSGGEQRRLAVAGVIAMCPDILVLDEPFTGLDWTGCDHLITVLTELHRTGTAILVITHDLEKILAHAQRLLLMDGGKIVAEGPPEPLLEQVESLGIRRPLGPIHKMSWSKTK